MNIKNERGDEAINIASQSNSKRVSVFDGGRRSLIGFLLLAGLMNLLVTAGLQAAKPLPPTAPSNPAASAVSSSRVDLTWQDNSSNESGFIVQRALSSGGPWSQIVTTPQDVRWYSSLGLNAGTTYYYRVCAYNSRGNSSYSTTASATTPSGGCSYTISPNSASFGAVGGGASVSVTTGGTCPWTATSGASWITITAGASGTGNGWVSYSIAANPGSARNGTMTIAGSTFTVDQSGGACSYSISPGSASLAAIGGGGSVSVTAGGTCGWTATSGASWITITSGASGTGNGTVSYTVVANTGAGSRNTTLTIAGQTFTVTQTGDITPPNSVSLTTPTGGATLSGVANFTGIASDDVQVSRVEFWCDGTVLLGTANAAPYAISYNTTGAANGTHNFVCKAYDAAGNNTTSSSVGATINNAQQSTNSWAKRFGGTGSDSGTAVAVAGNGDIIVVGTFQGAVDFGGGILNSASGSSDMFLARYSAAGAHLWSKRFGGTGAESPLCITLDSSGNVIIGGNYSGTGNFGGSDFYSLVGQSDAFLAKYSPQGAHLWSQAFGGPLSDQINSVTVDSQANVIVTGFFQADLSPMIIGTTSLLSWGMADTFLAKFSPNGVNLWAKNFNNSGRDQGNAVVVDRYDNILLAGYYLSMIDFGGGARSQPGGYLAKFSPSGVWLMDRTCAAGGQINGMVRDVNGDVIVTGGFFNQVNLGGKVGDAGSSTFTGIAYNNDTFVARYAAADLTYKMGNVVLGTVYEGASSVAVDAQNNIVLTGSFEGTLNFGGQQYSSIPSGQDIPDGFMVKFSSTFAPVWASQLGGTASDAGYSVAVDPAGSPVVTGVFSGSANIGGQVLTSAGSTDGFLMRRNP